MKSKWHVIDSDCNSFIESLVGEEKKLYTFIKDLLSKIPHNPYNDNAFSILSEVDETEPMMSYKKGFLIKYRLFYRNKKVLILQIEREIRK